MIMVPPYRLTQVAALSGWSPLQLGSSLLAWWDAERADLITVSGGLVSSWKDAVGAYDAVQTVGASKPAYSATSFNGRAGLTFDGTDDELTFTGVPAGIPTAANPSEVWTLVSQDALVADATGRTSFSYGGAGNNTRFCERAVSGGVNRADAASGSGAGVVTCLNAGVDFSGRHVVRNIFTATAVQCDVDGVVGTPQAVVPSTNTTRGRIGANSAGTPGAYWNGVHSTVLVVAPLTAAEATLLYAYLNRRL